MFLLEREEREVDRFYYRIQKSNMTYETNNITLGNTCDHEWRVSMLKKFTNECCNQECTLSPLEKFVQR